MTKPQRSPDRVVSELADIRPQIREARAHLDALLSMQNALYVEGWKLGTTKKRMAQAGGPEFTVGESAVWQVVKRWEEANPTEAG